MGSRRYLNISLTNTHRHVWGSQSLTGENSPQDRVPCGIAIYYSCLLKSDPTADSATLQFSEKRASSVGVSPPLQLNWRVITSSLDFFLLCLDDIQNIWPWFLTSATVDVLEQPTLKHPNYHSCHSAAVRVKEYTSFWQLGNCLGTLLRWSSLFVMRRGLARYFCRFVTQPQRRESKPIQHKSFPVKKWILVHTFRL